jgi:hypothetical protein
VALGMASTEDAIAEENAEPVAKKPKISDDVNESIPPPNLRDLSVEVERFAQLLSEAID